MLCDGSKSTLRHLEEILRSKCSILERLGYDVPKNRF